MGFGSYDESEQENQSLDTDEMDSESVEGEQHAHEGNIEYEFDASNDELLDKLEDIKNE